MKEGTGSDPFVEDEPDDQDEEVLEERPTSESSSGTEASAATVARENQGRPKKDDIPYILRRNRVTDERTLHSFYLRDMVDIAEQECRHDVQQQLGEEVPKADLREAALLVAYRSPDLVAAELREWGYDME